MSDPSTSTPPATVVVSSSNPDGLDDSDVLNDVFIESTWRGRTVQYDREQQSEPIQTKESGNQAKHMVTAGNQTESLTIRELKPDAPLPNNFSAFLQRVYPDISAQLEANLESHAFDDYLVSWDEERDAYENVFSLTHAAAISELGLPTSTSSSASNKKKHRHHGPPQMEEHAAVLGVSWSCNGSVLVASYGSSAHPGWCNHSAATLSFWNIMRRQISSTKPDFSLEQDCCCMCVAYHPERPTWLAGGMFNGEVRVWDTSLLEDGNDTLEDGVNPQAVSDQRSPCIMRSSIDDHFHREPITRVEWVRDSTKAWQLVTVSGDGKVLFWPMEDSSNKLQYPTDGYILAPTEKWSGQKLLAPNGSIMSQQRNKFAVLGGTCIAFPPAASSTGINDPSPSSNASIGQIGSYFIAGTEGGGILRIPLSTIMKRKGHLKSGDSRWNRDAYRLIEQADPATKFELKKSIEKYAKSIGAESIELSTVFDSHPPPSSLYPTSVDLTYEPHAGPVYGLEFNKFDRNIFATASTDGRVKVFNGHTSTPLLTLEPGSDYLFTLSWSPSRPLVFGVSDGDGRIFVFDLLASMLQPALTIPVNADKTPIETIEWNALEPSLLACGDMKGRVNVFNLSAKYSKIQPGEKQLLEQMARAGARR